MTAPAHEMSNKTEEDEEDGGLEVPEVVPLQPSPPDGGWGWMVVFASFMIHVLADGFTYTFGVFFVQLMPYFDSSAAATSWIASILVGVTLGSGPIAGSLVNRFGCRIVTMAGAVLASISLFCSIWATSVEILYLTIGLGAGLGFGLIYLPAIVCVTGYFEKKRSFATGIAVCGSGIGTFVFSPMVEKMIEEFSWQGCMVVLSAIVLNCVVFGALFRPLEDNQYSITEDNNDETEMPMIKFDSFCSYDFSVPENYSCEFNVKKMSDITIPEITVEDAESYDESSYTDNYQAPVFSYLKVSESSPVNKIRENFSDNNLILQSNSGTTNGNVNYNQFGSHGALNPLQENLKNQETSRMAVSQPLLAGVAKSPSRTSSNQQFSVMGSSQRIGPAKSGSLPPSHHGSGLLYRKDIFYRGSLVNLPEYKNNPQGYRMSITKLPDAEDIEQHDEKSKVCGCIPCNRETRDALYSLTDWSLLTDGIFLLFSLSNFCTSIGFNAPYVFIVDRAVHLGVSNNDAAYLLSVVGIANTVSRIGLGWISDQAWVNRLYLYNVALTICGVGTCCVFWMTSYAAQVFYAVLFGSMSGAYVGLTSVVLVDLLGMEKLTNAFGLLLMFQGIASLIGPPMCGALFDYTGSYDYSFLLAGSMIAISGLMLFFIPCIWKIQARKIAKEDANRL